MEDGADPGAIAVMAASDRPAMHARLLCALASASGIELDCRPVTDATCLATALAWRQPGVLLLDKPLRDRLDRRSLRRIQSSPVRVLLVAGQAGRAVVADVLRHRFRGLLLATTPPELVVKAIRAVSNGELWLSRRVMARVITDPAWHSAAADVAATADADDPHAMATLSRRESQVVAQLQQGCSNKEIARELGIMEDTVKKHLKSIFTKLGVHRRALVVLQASASARTPGSGNRSAAVTPVGRMHTPVVRMQGLRVAGPVAFPHPPVAGAQGGRTSARPPPPLPLQV